MVNHNIIILSRVMRIIKINSYLLLKSKDVRNTAVNRISEAWLCFIANGDDCIKPLGHRNAQEKLGHIASPKNFVHSSKMGCTLLCIKIRSEDTTRNTFSSEKLASATRATSTTTTTTHRQLELLWWDDKGYEMIRLWRRILREWRSLFGGEKKGGVLRVRIYVGYVWWG